MGDVRHVGPAVVGLMVAAAAATGHARIVTDFGDILFWAGSGTNQAALVLDFGTAAPQASPPAVAWGYRWNGEAHLDDMVFAITGSITGANVPAPAPGSDPRLGIVATYFASFQSYFIQSFTYDQVGLPAGWSQESRSLVNDFDNDRAIAQYEAPAAGGAWPQPGTLAVSPLGLADTTLVGGGWYGYVVAPYDPATFAYPATVSFSRPTAALPAPVTAIVIDVGSGSTVTQGQAGYPLLTPAIATSVTKTGGGTVVFDAANTYTGTTSIDAGTLRATIGPALQATPLAVQTGGTLALPTAARVVLTAPSLTVDQATGGTVDIGTGRIEIAPGGITESDLRVDLIAGRTGAGTFSGTSGIMTTGGKASPNSLNPVVGYRMLVSGTTVVAWAAYGDVNLDGVVNLTDLQLINSGGRYDQGAPASWVQGDLNYDNVVNLTDIQLLNGAGLYGQGSYLPAAGPGSLAFDAGGAPPVLAAVPEPAATTLAAAGAAALAWRLWRRRRWTTLGRTPRDPSEPRGPR